MKLTVLADNNAFIDQYYLGEPAVSYYIEIDDCRILFDTGYSDAFLKTGTSIPRNPRLSCKASMHLSAYRTVAYHLQNDRDDP